MMNAVLCLAFLSVAVAAVEENYHESSGGCSNSVCRLICQAKYHNKCGGKCVGSTCVCSKCPTNGKFSPWSGWSPCTRTCGTGLKQRRRTCTNPAPSNGGRYCTGDPMQYELCATKTCAINGKWATWSSWSKCSTTCGSGLRQRSRTCTNPKPAHGGDSCQGDPEEYKLCTNGECKSVSFTAAFPSASSYTNGQTIIFSNIINNDGEAYSASTGKFTVPVDGKYSFSLTIVTKQRYQVSVLLMVNSKQIGQVLSDYDYYGTYGSGSVTSIADLRKGDKVYAMYQSGTSSTCIYHSASYLSYFAGALI